MNTLSEFDPRITENQALLLGALDGVIQALSRLADAVREDAHLPAEIQWGSPDMDPRQRIAQAVINISYENDQAPDKTPLYPGVVGASAATLHEVENVNLAKNRFFEAVQSMRKYKIRIGSAYPIPLADYVLKRIFRMKGLRPGHRAQIYRIFHVPQFRESGRYFLPVRISFMWARTSRVSRMSFEQSCQFLHRNGYEELIPVLEASGLSHFALVEPQEPHPRANLTYPDPDDPEKRGGEVPPVPASLPLFVPFGKGDRWPTIRPLSQLRRKRKPRRRDALQPDPICQALDRTRSKIRFAFHAYRM